MVSHDIVVAASRVASVSDINNERPWNVRTRGTGALIFRLTQMTLSWQNGAAAQYTLGGFSYSLFVTNKYAHLQTCISKWHFCCKMLIQLVIFKVYKTQCRTIPSNLNFWILTIWKDVNSNSICRCTVPVLSQKCPDCIPLVVLEMDSFESFTVSHPLNVGK